MAFDATGETFDDLVRCTHPDIAINHVHHAGNSSGVVDGSAALLIGTVLDELERRALSTGLVTMCAAGGMAPAIIIERI